MGKSVPRVDAFEKVTGRARFTRDTVEPGMLYAKVLRSPYAHAYVKSIDVSQAEAMPGVEAVIHCMNTSQMDFNWSNEPIQSPPQFNIIKDQRLFNREVRYVGDEVCVVAAVSEKVAQEALKTVKVEYELLPIVLSAEDALRPGAPILHPHVNEKENIAGHTENQKGDTEKAFAQCAAVVEERYCLPVQKQMQLETQNALAFFSGDGKLTVYSPTQSPALVQRLLGWICGIPMSKIRVANPGYVGGAFGVRIGLSAKAELYAVELARRTGKPVKITYDRQEDTIASETRHGGTIRIKLGCDKEGHFLAMDVDALMETGAYALSSGSICGAISSRIQTVYHIPNVRFRGRAVYTNTTPAGAMRGYGAPQPAFALENTVNRLAERLGIDPVTIRKRNLLTSGEQWGNPYRLRTMGLAECLDKGVEEIGWNIPRQKQNGRYRRGLGLACGNHISSGYPFQIEHANIYICMNYDGTIQFGSGMMEMGTGLKTTLTQIVAEELGTEIGMISATMGDTTINMADMGAQASRGLYVTGQAAKRAAAKLRGKILHYAEERLDLDAGSLSIRQGHIVDQFDNSYFTLPEIARDADDHMLQFSAIGRYQSYNACPYHAHFADVTVDLATGNVRVNRFVAVHDIGRAINPDIVKGQIEGGVLQGVGYALREEITYSVQGKQQHDNFHKYMLPVAGDVGEVIAQLVETYEPSGPYGAKGMSESPVGTVAPAIAAAIHDATGLWLTQAPMTPERVLFALKEHKIGW